MIKLLGIVPTARAEFDEQCGQVSPAEYNDSSYYAMSTSPVGGLTEVDKPELAPVFAGVDTYYYSFTDELLAKELLGIQEQNGDINE